MTLVNSLRGTYGPQSKAPATITELPDFVGVEPIQSINLTQEPAPSVTFSNIPQGYRHLLLISSASASSLAYLAFRFNNVSSSSYYAYRTGGNGSTTFPAYGGQLTSIGASYVFPSSTQFYGGTTSIIYNYSSSSMFTTTMTYGGWDLNGSGQSMFDAGMFYATSPVTSMTILQNNSGDFNIYSSFSLYGFGEIV